MKSENSKDIVLFSRYKCRGVRSVGLDKEAIGSPDVLIVIGDWECRQGLAATVSAESLEEAYKWCRFLLLMCWLKGAVPGHEFWEDLYKHYHGSR